MMLFSCTRLTDEDLHPTIEILGKNKIIWNSKPAHLFHLDSLLSDYKEDIPQRLRDSIQVKFIVPVNETSMGTVLEVKSSLRKNKIFRVTYVAKK